MEAAWRQIMTDNPFPAIMGRVCYLTCLGHAVTIKDAGSQPGGMMRYGIPKYRLPRDVMDAEIDRILEMGVSLEARRCMSCGNCFGCDNCYGACPDNAVIKLDAGHYEIDLD